MELIYTTRHRDFEPGKHYRNPEYFERAERGVESVVLDGNFPAVRDAYEALNVPVSDAQSKAAPKAQAEPEKPAEGDSKPKRGRPRKTESE
ncbi:hypothetical protein [Modicisalibacter coralii]|uniref:hypothetical protein n=1 Tax=Modicisalibacter coralii TaxID=2304602 RepID=UPI00100B2DD7|nr:hypothetical protein [Halomonas coralii]